jgi:hypothetical protein
MSLADTVLTIELLFSLFSSKSSRVRCSFWQVKKVLVIPSKSKKKMLSLSFAFGVWRLAFGVWRLICH